MVAGGAPGSRAPDPRPLPATYKLHGLWKGAEPYRVINSTISCASRARGGWEGLRRYTEVSL